MSFPALSELAEIFVPSMERRNAKDAKNAPARLSHLSMSLSGSQIISPYRVIPALVTAMPMKLANVNAIGMMMTCIYWL
jgi:hypothetical protein